MGAEVTILANPYTYNFLKGLTHRIKWQIIRKKGAIFPTPPKSYATIFLGVHRTLFWFKTPKVCPDPKGMVFTHFWGIWGHLDA